MDAKPEDGPAAARRGFVEGVCRVLALGAVVDFHSLVDQLLRAILSLGREEMPEALGEIKRVETVAHAKIYAPPVEKPPEPPEFLTMPEVATLMRISVTKARQLGRDGKIPVVLVPAGGPGHSQRHLVRVDGVALRRKLQKREVDKGRA